MSALKPIGFSRQRADVLEPGAKLVAIYEGQRDRLHHAEPARFADRGDELGIGAGIHRAADERDFTPVWRVNAVSIVHMRRTGPSRQRTWPVATSVPSRSKHSAMTSKSVSSVTAGTATCATRADHAARLLVVRHRKSRDDAAHRGRQRGHHREATRHLGQIHERDRVHGAQMVAVRATVGNLDLGVARLEHADARADGARVRNRKPKSFEKSHAPPGSGERRRQRLRNFVPASVI